MKKKIILDPEEMVNATVRDLEILSGYAESEYGTSHLTYALEDLAERLQEQFLAWNDQREEQFQAAQHEAKEAQLVDSRRAELLATLAQCESFVDDALESLGVGIEHLHDGDDWERALESLAKLRRGHRTLRLDLEPKADIDTSDNHSEAAE